jgi:hypothetical protein
MHRAGALFQEWIVVQWAKIEQQKLSWFQPRLLFKEQGSHFPPCLPPPFAVVAASTHSPPLS